MPPSMRRDALQTGSIASSAKSFLDVTYTLTVDVQDVSQIAPTLARPPEVGHQPRRYRDLATPLIRATPPGDLEIGQRSLDVHLGPAQRQDRFFAAPRVEAQENEKRQIEPCLLGSCPAN